MTKLTRRTPHARLFTGAIACLLAFACAGGPPPDVGPVAPRGATPVGFSSGIRTETRDFDFNKQNPKYQINKGPFYAAWCTPVLHDTRAGLRINAKMQVVDMQGQVISGLYAGGEVAGGFSMHGLPRCTCQGMIAGREAGKETA